MKKTLDNLEVGDYVAFAWKYGIFGDEIIVEMADTFKYRTKFDPDTKAFDALNLLLAEIVFN